MEKGTRVVRAAPFAVGHVQRWIWMMLLLSALTSLEAATRTWSGAGANNLWSNRTNWIGNTAPIANDSIVFPDAAAQKANVNNLAAGSSLRSITFGGSGYAITGNPILLTDGIAATNAAGNNSLGIALGLTGAQEWIVESTLTLGGSLTGAGGITKTGSGTLLLSGGGTNTFSGPTVVSRGILALAKDFNVAALSGTLTIGDGTETNAATVRFDSSSQMPGSPPVVINRSGLLHLNHNSQTFGGITMTGGAIQTGIGTLTLNGDVTVNASAGGSVIDGNVTLTGGPSRTFTVADGAATNDLIIAARMLSSGGTGLTKEGAGQLLLTANNSYTGDSILNAGTLLINGTHPSFTSVLVHGGILGGVGTVGPITAFGGTIAPGASAGVLKSRSVILSAAATFRAEANGTNANQFDQLKVTGSLQLGNALLQFEPGATAPGDFFEIIDNDGSDAIAGTFLGLGEGTFLTNGAALFSITYTGGTGNDVVITRINSVLRIQSLQPLAGNQMRVEGIGLAGVAYAVEASTNLAGWSEIGTTTANSSGLYQFIDTQSGMFNKRFYRIRGEKARHPTATRGDRQALQPPLMFEPIRAAPASTLSGNHGTARQQPPQLLISVHDVRIGNRRHQ